MKQLLVCSLLISVLTLAFSALVGDNRYAGPHSGNSLNHRNVGGYHVGGPHSVRGPVPYSAPRAPTYSSHQAAPSTFGGGRHYSAAPARPSHYAAPSHYSAPAAYGARSHVSARSPYAAPAQNVYQPHSAHSQPIHSQPIHSQPIHNTRLGSGTYPQSRATYQQHSESKSQSHGREMKYTVRDPNSRGTTHVSETHVISNRQMHGAEAEAAMKKLMGSMGNGPSYGSDGGFQDFVKNMGLPFY